MTRAGIVLDITNNTKLTQVEIKSIVDGVFESIISAIAMGKRIELRGFGVFNHKTLKPRKARNPKTGESVALGKRHVPYFKASPEFRKAVNEALKEKSEKRK
jgi:nucleoid DNA-binding protein